MFSQLKRIKYLFFDACQEETFTVHEDEHYRVKVTYFYHTESAFQVSRKLSIGALILYFTLLIYQYGWRFFMEIYDTFGYIFIIMVLALSEEMHHKQVSYESDTIRVNLQSSKPLAYHYQPPSITIDGKKVEFSMSKMQEGVVTEDDSPDKIYTYQSHMVKVDRMDNYPLIIDGNKVNFSPPEFEPQRSYNFVGFLQSLQIDVLHPGNLRHDRRDPPKSRKNLLVTIFTVLVMLLVLPVFVVLLLR